MVPMAINLTLLICLAPLFAVLIQRPSSGPTRVRLGFYEAASRIHSEHSFPV